jgi:hypothetical protein
MPLKTKDYWGKWAPKAVDIPLGADIVRGEI